MHIQFILPAVLLILLARLIYTVYIQLTSPLRSIPGPLLTRLNRLWFFNRVRLGHFESDNIALHRQYGPIVRIAPDMYSIDSPDVIKPVYGIGSKFPKSDWYEGWKHPSPDRWTLFPDRDIKRHAETRKRFQGLYSLTSLVSYEGYVDECSDIFDAKLRGFAEAGTVIDMAHWFQCYAFDVIGDISYSRRFGFLDRGEDVAGVMEALHAAMIYGTLVGIYAWVHPIVFDFLARFKWSGAGGRLYIMKYVTDRVEERKKVRMEAEKTGRRRGDLEKNSGADDENAPRDFLDKLMDANEEDPDKVTSYHVFMMGLSNIFAGSDTTAVSLSSILYNLLRYPDTLRKLREEIDSHQADGRASSPHITFKESQDMPYLQAVIKEALRLHPATGLPLWRVVPEGGAEICGQFFPGGTTVGLNTWVAHYNEDVFGPDAKVFRPERWIENDEEEIKRMDAYYLPFGLGSRTCLGRHISTLEMSKLIPRIVRDFDFTLKLEGGAREWDTSNYWFVKPVGFKVGVKVRL